MTGRGLDGVLYTFVVTPRTQIPYISKLSDGFLQRKKSDKDLTEPSNATFNFAANHLKVYGIDLPKVWQKRPG